MGVTIKFLGHASFQIKAGKIVIYIDLRKYGGVVETSENADLILIPTTMRITAVRRKFRSFGETTQPLLRRKAAFQKSVARSRPFNPERR